MLIRVDGEQKMFPDSSSSLDRACDSLTQLNSNVRTILNSRSSIRFIKKLICFLQQLNTCINSLQPRTQAFNQFINITKSYQVCLSIINPSPSLFNTNLITPSIRLMISSRYLRSNQLNINFQMNWNLKSNHSSIKLKPVSLNFKNANNY